MMQIKANGKPLNPEHDSPLNRNLHDKPLVAKKRPRTSSGLRDLLFDELESLSRGESEPMQAASVARLATAIIKTAEVELQYLQMRGERTDIQKLEFLKGKDE